MPAGWPGGLQIGVRRRARRRGVVARRGRAALPVPRRRREHRRRLGGRGTSPTARSRRSTRASRRTPGLLPVFSYYQLLQSAPSGGGGEDVEDRAKLADAATMRDYYADFRVLMQRAAGARPGDRPRRAGPLGVPPARGDGRRRGDRAGCRSRRPATPTSRGCPDTAAGFAQALVRLRDRYAPNVLARVPHVLVGDAGPTSRSTTRPTRRWTRWPRGSSAFYRSLGARFDLTFADQADRDAGSTGVWWDAADYERGARLLGGFAEATGQRIALWQLPLGNSTLPAGDRDNHVEWFLDDPSRAHLQRYADAGVIALLFGAGAGERDRRERGRRPVPRAGGGVPRGRAAGAAGRTGGPGGGPGGRRAGRRRRGRPRRGAVRAAAAHRAPRPPPARPGAPERPGARARPAARHAPPPERRRSPAACALRGAGVYRARLRVPRGVARGRWKLAVRLPGAARAGGHRARAGALSRAASTACRRAARARSDSDSRNEGRPRGGAPA